MRKSGGAKQVASYLGRLKYLMTCGPCTSVVTAHVQLFYSLKAKGYICQVKE